MTLGTGTPEIRTQAPMYDRAERLSLWRASWRATFRETDATLMLADDGTVWVSGRVDLERTFNVEDIDLNNWIGRMQIQSALDAYRNAPAGS